MSTAVITFVYNEAVNLPLWLKYYGGLFGEANLFIIDHGSSDGSTDHIGRANRLYFPREELDEHKRCVFMAPFVKGLLEYFDTVIYTDCDEFLVPDLSKYRDLKDYIHQNKFEYIAGLGLNLVQMISIEPVLDLNQPILRQRKFVWFSSAVCKPLITRIPLVWETGFHFCDQPVQIDRNLFNIHLKMMDCEIALKKQKLTREMKWAVSSLQAGHGAHARYDDDRFLREMFLDPNNLLMNGQRGPMPFDFSEEIDRIKSQVECRGGIFVFPHFTSRIAELPESLRSAF